MLKGMRVKSRASPIAILTPLFWGYTRLLGLPLQITGRGASWGVEGQVARSSSALPLRRLRSRDHSGGRGRSRTVRASSSLLGWPTASAGLLRNPNYRIADRVTIDNFQGVFKVDTKWGRFIVKGSDPDARATREIAATAELEKDGGAETVVNQAGATALRPLSTAKDLVTEPGRTIGDTFKGVGAIFGEAKAKMSAPTRTKRVCSRRSPVAPPRGASSPLILASIPTPLSAAERRAHPRCHGKRSR
jgi:hypothetical protein